jgi:hypothetical protein
LVTENNHKLPLSQLLVLHRSDPPRGKYLDRKKQFVDNETDYLLNPTP